VIFGTNQLRETTPTEKPRSHKEAGLSTRPETSSLKSIFAKESPQNCGESQDFTRVVALIKKKKKKKKKKKQKNLGLL
jgi:hypothetical protein